MSLSMRQKFELTHQELLDFQRLRPILGAAAAFWGKVAASRGLDPKSIISDAPKYTGLPKGHGKQWCFPAPLKCPKPPVGF